MNVSHQRNITNFLKKYYVKFRKSRVKKEIKSKIFNNYSKDFPKWINKFKTEEILSTEDGRTFKETVYYELQKLEVVYEVNMFKLIIKGNFKYLCKLSVIK